MGTFLDQFQQAVQRIQARAERVAEDVVIEVGERLLEYSPIGDPSTWKMPAPPGYVPGQFIASWHHSFDTPSSDFSSTIDRSGSPSRQEFKYGAMAQPFAAHFFTNSLPYAMPLEHGWSPQAPKAGIVGKTALDFPGIVRQVMAEAKP